MKSKWITTATVGATFAVLQFAPPLSAQDLSAQHFTTESRYILKDLGTAGGPNSYVADVTEPLNNERTVVGIADTRFADPFDPFCIYDCYLVHAFQWRADVLTDLGALKAGVSSLPNGINASGMVAGFSETGAIDPTFEEFPPLFHAVVWKDGQIIDLGTFGGTFSYAAAINDRGQTVGFALNRRSSTITSTDGAFEDQCGTGAMPSEMRAFIWQQGRGLQPLGTLGGPESCARYINQRGQVTGVSFTSYQRNPDSGIPTFEPFIWVNGRMTGLGGLGGTQGHPSGINNYGQIAGDSNLVGDEITHAYFWDHGEMTDIVPTADFAVAEAINDKGEVVGGAHNPGDETGFAYLWRHGVLTKLGACSIAVSINIKSQVVGQAFECDGNRSYAFLWEPGSPAVDLNDFVPPASGVELTKAIGIADTGEIAVQGVLANGNERAFLLIPRRH
jgi:probable HAF family extracellular repeat protein